MTTSAVELFELRLQENAGFRFQAMFCLRFQVSGLENALQTLGSVKRSLVGSVKHIKQVCSLTGKLMVKARLRNPHIFPPPAP